MMNILVTGGAGYIGAQLVAVLGQKQHKVRVLDLVSTGRDSLQNSIRDPAVVARAVQDVGVVYHLAWDFHPGDERREIQENLFGTLNLLQAALRSGVQHFLFVSTALVYGPTGPARVREEHPCHPERCTIGGPVHSVTKLACERLCLVYQRRGLPVTIFRLHGVFSAGHLGQFGQMIDQALSGEPVRCIRGAGGQYIHLEDVLRALFVAMDNPRARGEVFNLAGTHTYADPEIACFAVEAASSGSTIELIEDPTKEMISVSTDKLRTALDIESGKGEFLTSLMRVEIEQRRGIYDDIDRIRHNSDL
jgi:UDP-glucose 4-epimerase